MKKNAMKHLTVNSVDVFLDDSIFNCNICTSRGNVSFLLTSLYKTCFLQLYFRIDE